MFCCVRHTVYYQYHLHAIFSLRVSGDDDTINTCLVYGVYQVAITTIIIEQQCIVYVYIHKHTSDSQHDATITLTDGWECRMCTMMVVRMVLETVVLSAQTLALALPVCVGGGGNQRVYLGAYTSIHVWNRMWHSVASLIKYSAYLHLNSYTVLFWYQCCTHVALLVWYRPGDVCGNVTIAFNMLHTTTQYHTLSLLCIRVSLSR